MPGPIDALRFVHAAISREVVELEQLGDRCQGPEDVRALGERVAFLGYVVKGHTDGEELGLFPALEERAPHVGAAYLHDHVDEQALFRGLAALAADATTGAGPHLLGRVRRQTVALTEHLEPHIKKENELILPLVARLFDAAEQGAIVGRIMSSFSPADFRKIVPFMASRMNQDERAAYLGVVFRTQPPETAQAVAGLVRQGTPAADWEQLKPRVPGLA
jgi:hemerythrin-like domain-containing protein